MCIVLLLTHRVPRIIQHLICWCPWQPAILPTFEVLARKVIRVNVIQACPVYFAKIFLSVRTVFLSILSHGVCVRAGRRGRRFEHESDLKARLGENCIFVQQLNRAVNEKTALPGHVIPRCILGNGVCFITAVVQYRCYSIVYCTTRQTRRWAHVDIKEIDALPPRGHPLS